MRRLNLTLIFIFYFFLAKAQKTEFPLNEFTLSINRTHVHTSDNSESRNGFGFAVYHSPKADSGNRLVIGLEFNQTSQFKEHANSYSQFTPGENNVTYDFDFITIYAGHRINFKSDIKWLLDLGGFLDIGVSSTAKGEVYNSNGSFGIFPGLSIAPGVRIPIADTQIILKPEYKLLFPLKDDLHEEHFLYNYYRLAIGMKYF